MITMENKLWILEEIREASKTVYSYRELSEKLGITCMTLFYWLEKYFSNYRNDIESNLKANKEKRREEEKIKQLSELKQVSLKVASFKELEARTGVKNPSNWIYENFPEEITIIKANLNRKKRENKEQYKVISQRMEKIKYISKEVYSFEELTEKVGIPYLYDILTIYFPKEKSEIKSNLKSNRKKKKDEKMKQKREKDLVTLEKVKELSRIVSTFKELSERIGKAAISSWLDKNFPEEKIEIEANLKANKEKENNEKKMYKQNENLLMLELVKEISMRVSTFNEISEEIGKTAIGNWLDKNFPEEKIEIEANLKANKEKKNNEKSRQKQNEKLIILEKIKAISMRVSTFNELSQEIGISSINEWLALNFPNEKAKIKANIEANRLKKKEKIEREYLEMARKVSKRAYSVTEIAIEIKINLTSLSNSLRKFPEINEEVQNNITTNKAKKINLN